MVHQSLCLPTSVMPSVRTSAGPNWATKMAPEMPQPKSSHPGQAEYHSDHKQGPWGVRSASFKRQHLLGVTLRDFERKLYHCQRWFSNQRRQPTVASSYLLSGAVTGYKGVCKQKKTWIFTRTWWWLKEGSTVEDGCLGVRGQQLNSSDWTRGLTTCAGLMFTLIFWAAFCLNTEKYRHGRQRCRVRVCIFSRFDVPYRKRICGPDFTFIVFLLSFLQHLHLWMEHIKLGWRALFYIKNNLSPLLLFRM